MPALIGALMLMGIVTKNSILLIERAVDNEATRGMDPIAALIEACTTRPPRHHDHHRHGGRDDPRGALAPRRGILVPTADGRGGHRRIDGLYRPQPPLRAGVQLAP